jgi:hypothetical protein
LERQQYGQEAQGDGASDFCTADEGHGDKVDGAFLVTEETDEVIFGDESSDGFMQIRQIYGSVASRSPN